jgi:putative phosphoesterase
MVLEFPIMADYALLPLNEEHTAFVTHGHLFNIDNPPPHKPGDVLIHGHTHVHCAIEQGDYVYINPGSAALPKENQAPSYMIYENGVFTVKDLNSGEVLLTYSI